MLERSNVRNRLENRSCLILKMSIETETETEAPHHNAYTVDGVSACVCVWF